MLCWRPVNPERAAPSSTVLRLALLAVLLLAFALRAYHLDFQSLWSDEGISIVRAAQSWGALWRNMPVEHTPGYFALLRAWITVIDSGTGTDDYSLRFLSLLPSVAAVALIYRLGQSLGSRSAGFAAALLLATGAFQVWYAQELRMYSWVLALGLLSTWACWRVLESDDPFRPTRWLGYVVSTTAVLYLHYFSFLIPIAQSVIAVVWLVWRRRTRAFLAWAAAGLAIFVLYLPWLMRAVALFGFTGWRTPLDPSSIPRLLLWAYSVGDAMPPPWSTWLPWVYLALALWGVVAWWQRSREAGLFLTLFVLVAAAVVWLLVLRQPDFHVRYTIFLSAPFLLLVAGGIAGLSLPKRDVRSEGFSPAPGRTYTRRLLPLAVLIGLALANGLALQRLYTDDSLHKPDFRGAVAAISANLQSGDIVLVDGPNPELVFNHYYHGDAPVYDLRYLEKQDDAAIDAELTRLTAGARRVWELLYFKPPGPVQVWLATRAWAATPTYHNNVRVQLYGVDDAPLREQPIGVAFGPELELVSAGISPAANGAAFRPGELVRVSTHWFTHAPAPEYRFSLRLVNAAGDAIQALDYTPQNWFAPTNVWIAGQPATDQHALMLPADLAPGPYQITLRLYDPSSGAPVETAAGVDVPLANIDVAADD